MKVHENSTHSCRSSLEPIRHTHTQTSHCRPLSGRKGQRYRHEDLRNVCFYLQFSVDCECFGVNKVNPKRLVSPEEKLWKNFVARLSSESVSSFHPAIAHTDRPLSFSCGYDQSCCSMPIQSRGPNPLFFCLSNQTRNPPGTTNFVHGFPMTCVSIGFGRGGKVSLFSSALTWFVS